VAPVARDAVPDAAKASELLDVEVDELAGTRAIVPPRRLAPLQLRQPAQPEAGQVAGDGAVRQMQMQGDLLTGHSVVAAGTGDHGEPGRSQLVGDQVRR
jgi:hypothetical protein